MALYDIFQKRHTILRNFPIIGHFRYLLEMIRPEIQQYFIESDTDEDPIARIDRMAVYATAKDELSTVPFGSQLNFYGDGYKWISHSNFPVAPGEEEFRVMIGNKLCSQPYSASLLNVSAMSFGALSKEAVIALGNGAKTGGFYHNTGEGGLSPYHLQTGADLVWQLGTAYFGARDSHGHFDPGLFQENASHQQVKMIEIKISQGAKPGHGGVLPASKVTEEIARVRNVEMGKDTLSPSGHSAFTNPTELCEFVQRLRELSGGKPVGFKLCIGRREEFLKICDAIKETALYPDFITVDGGEGGTGAAPYDFINYVGSPLDEALHFVDKSLKDSSVRDHIRLIASGKVHTAFKIFEKLALGADLCNSARGMMFALGCIQAYRCNTNQCPTGITTMDPSLRKGLVVKDKSVRVARYHKKVIVALNELIGAAGLKSPEEVQLHHIACRMQGRILSLKELYEETGLLAKHEKESRHTSVEGDAGEPLPKVSS